MKSERLDVAVTSRAAESNALWMINHLRSQTYRDLLGRVTYLPITNSNQSEWRSEIQKHSFSILYHTKNQGRINLTDVTDSLYDRELQELSKTLVADMKSERLDVAVTSRAAESNALWMINHLRSPTYRDLLGRVTYLPITNSNQSEWRSEIQKHSFSILYHTKNQGRINLTDVTDSLYDRELQELSKTLGRDNVMVVVDDLVKSDEEERQRIVEHQPSLSRWALQLLLFSESEKNPVPAHKQQVLLQTFRRAHKDDQRQHIYVMALNRIYM